MKLSKDLSLDEVIRSATADRLKIRNDNITDVVLSNLKAVAEVVFQPARDKLGPIRVLSGYRSPELNKAIGGAPNSQHCTGEALDLEALNVTNKELFLFIKDHIEFDQLIWEFGTEENPEWVHVSHRHDTKNRKQVLQSVKEHKKTVYLHWPKSD